MDNEINGCPNVLVSATTLKASSSETRLLPGHEDRNVKICLFRKPKEDEDSTDHLDLLTIVVGQARPLTASDLNTSCGVRQQEYSVWQRREALTTILQQDTTSVLHGFHSTVSS